MSEATTSGKHRLRSWQMFCLGCFVSSGRHFHQLLDSYGRKFSHVGWLWRTRGCFLPVGRFNSFATNSVRQTGGFYLRHINLPTVDNVNYLLDGVHLSPAGNKLFLDNLSFGLHNFLQGIQPWFAWGCLNKGVNPQHISVSGLAAALGGGSEPCLCRLAPIWPTA